MAMSPAFAPLGREVRPVLGSTGPSPPVVRRAEQAGSGGAQGSFQATAAALATSVFVVHLHLKGRRRGQRHRHALVIREAVATETAEGGSTAPAERKPVAWARVAKRGGDIAIVVTNPLGQLNQDDARLPEPGDAVRFPSGAVGTVVAVSDLCFAVALLDPTLEVYEGDTYRILPKSQRPRIRRPDEGGKLLDLLGRELGKTEMPLDDDDGTRYANWVNEIVDLIRRTRINAPLHAGVMPLDAFLPIGRGQSMLLRLPGKISDDQLQSFFAHIIEAQGENNVQIMVPAATPAQGAQLQAKLKEAPSGKRLTVVCGTSEKAKLGEALCAINAACGLAEAHRDQGGDALFIIDLEPMYKVWAMLTEVSNREQLSERANQRQNQEIESLTPELGVALWKYVAKKNAVTARRRTFLGCFLQRAGRMAEDEGGGSLTLLAFARLKDEKRLSKLELEVKRKTLETMKLEEDIRKRALEKLDQQLAAIGEDGGSFGVPDDFIEEAKAVTDGHVVFADAAGGTDPRLRWAVDLRESVARGITSNSVQNQPLDVLRSLNFKVFLMQMDDRDSKIDCLGGLKVDSTPLSALMSQPVGDVLSVKAEAALLLLAITEGEKALATRPLLEETLRTLVRAKVRFETPEVTQKFVTLARRWCEAQLDGLVAPPNLRALGTEALEDLVQFLELKPLEKTRFIAAASKEPDLMEEPIDLPSLKEDLAQRYLLLRARMASLQSEMPELLDSLEERGLSDKELLKRLTTLRERMDASVSP